MGGLRICCAGSTDLRAILWRGKVAIWTQTMLEYPFAESANVNIHDHKFSHTASILSVNTKL
jgi:hypothetical protein